MTKATVWVPRQHGAWAMLVVPFAAGVLMLLRTGERLPWWLAPLFACWLLGYFAFTAASGWLKAAPARRGRFLPPLVTYAAASGAFGLLTLLGAGWTLLGWVPVFLPLLVPALVLAARHRERATLGGALTTAAASLLVVVVACPDPAALLSWTPPVRLAVGVAAAAFAYFFGTVLYVKTHLRERGNKAFYAASVAWHGAAAVLAALGAHPAWAAFFAAATLRAAILPGRRLSPLRIGLVEIGLSAALLAVVALA